MLAYWKFRYTLGNHFRTFAVSTFLIASVIAAQDWVAPNAAVLLFLLPLVIGGVLGWILSDTRKVVILGFLTGLLGYAAGVTILSTARGQEFVAQFGPIGWAIAFLVGLLVGVVFGLFFGLWVAGACASVSYLRERTMVNRA